MEANGFVELVRVDSDKIVGIYKGQKLPKRMLWFDYAGESALYQIAERVVFTDMFRSAEASLWAVQNKRGALPPGFSAHNYGLAVDIDVDKSLKRFENKEALDLFMSVNKFICHRLDHKRGHEDWHYNFDVVVKKGERFSSTAVERKIVDMYVSPMDKIEVQGALTKLGFYHGAIDGKIGPITKQAIMAFQRAWCLTVDGVPGKKTQRVLNYVADGL